MNSAYILALLGIGSLLIGILILRHWLSRQIFIEVDPGTVVACGEMYRATNVRIVVHNWLRPKSAAEIYQLYGNCDPQRDIFRLDEVSRRNVTAVADALAGQLDFSITSLTADRFVAKVILTVEEEIDHWIITPQRITKAMAMIQDLDQSRLSRPM